MNDPRSYLLETEIIIHAGGLSERWWPVTKGKIPKPLTPLGKKPRPMIDWVILPYVVAGVKQFFISLWSESEVVKKHFDQMAKNTDLKFTYLIEPTERRLGKAGVVKHYLEEKVLDENKPKLNLNSSDIIKISPLELAKFQFLGTKKGFLATVLGSPFEISQFGRIVCSADTKVVRSFQEKPTVALPLGEFVNIGVLYLDSKLSKYYHEINDEELPVDWERSSFLPKIYKENLMRCLEAVVPLKTWFWLKDQKDYSRVKDMDLEKLFEVTSVERYLGPYQSQE